MSQPPVGPDPNQQPGYQQPGYQQPGYQQPGYGQAPPPAPGYGPPVPGYGPAAPTRRPGMVTAAAVIAFVSGGLNLLLGLFLLAASGADELAGVSTGVIVVIALLGIAFGAALIFGGLQALKGKDQRILVAVAGAAILLQVISWIAVGFDATSVISLLLPAITIALLMQPQSKQWFASKGAPTF